MIALPKSTRRRRNSRIQRMATDRHGDARTGWPAARPRRGGRRQRSGEHLKVLVGARPAADACRNRRAAIEPGGGQPVVSGISPRESVKSVSSAVLRFEFTDPTDGHGWTRRCPHRLAGGATAPRRQAPAVRRTPSDRGRVFARPLTPLAQSPGCDQPGGGQPAVGIPPWRSVRSVLSAACHPGLYGELKWNEPMATGDAQASQ